MKTESMILGIFDLHSKLTYNSGSSTFLWSFNW